MVVSLFACVVDGELVVVLFVVVVSMIDEAIETGDEPEVLDNDDEEPVGETEWTPLDELVDDALEARIPLLDGPDDCCCCCSCWWCCD